jgi:hypothetical protein
MNDFPEKNAYRQFIDQLKIGDDKGALDTLCKRFTEGNYIGADLFVYLSDNCLTDALLFLAIHYRCETTFNELKKKMQTKAEGDPCYLNVNGIYCVKLDQMSNLGDPALADQVANGMVPDLWPVPDDPNSFGVPSKCFAGEVEFDLQEVNYSDVTSSIKGKILESLVKVNVVTDYGRETLNESIERLTPEEFGDRSRDPNFMTLVYCFEEI